MSQVNPCQICQFRNDPILCTPACPDDIAKAVRKAQKAMFKEIKKGVMKRRYSPRDITEYMCHELRKKYNENHD